MQSGSGPQMGLFTINSQKFSLYEGLNTIGRNREAVVNIKHVIISQHHALITVLNGQFFISDLKSSNGSFLDGMRLLPLKMYPLINDAKITLGNLHGTLAITSNPPLEDPLVETQTQSICDVGTQLLQSTGNVHEELTQKILWPPSVPRYVPEPQIGEIHDEPLSVLENFVEIEPDPQLETVEPSSPGVISDDEITDCEENPGPSGENDAKNHEATFCDKSNESLEFSNQSPATAQPNGAESLGSSDEDSFAFKRTRKSFMVISTQDFQENASVSNSQQLEETIPATQYPSALELNESDIIAATQAVRPDGQSSESEFFKLGLTQLMGFSQNVITSPAAEPAPERNESIDATHVSPTQTRQNNEDIYAATTQKVASSADETFNIFDAPTQKLRTEGDLFLQPTQPMFSEALEDFDFDSPTQKVSDNDDDTFLAPTQKLSFSAATPKENEDYFLAPTQRVLRPKRVYSFKKTKCNLNASLSVLAVDEAETGQPKPVSAATGKRKNNEVIPQPGEVTFMESPTEDFSKPQSAEGVEGLQTKHGTFTGANSKDSFKTNNAVELQANNAVTLREIEAKPEEACENSETFTAVSSAEPEAGENASSKPPLPNGPHSSVEAKSEETVYRASMPSTREHSANFVNPFVIEDAEERSDRTSKCPKNGLVASDTHQETVRSDCKNSQINGGIPLAVNIDVPPKLEYNFASENIDKPHKRLKRQCRGKPSVEVKSGDKPKETAGIEDVAAVHVEETSKEEIANPSRIDQSMALLASKMIKTRKTTKTEKIRINFPNERKSMALSVDEGETPTTSRRSVAEGKRAKSSKLNEKPPTTRATKRTNNEQAAGESKKQRQQLEDTPRRDLRTQRHRVVFTMLNSPQLECLVKQLGGSIVNSVDSCTVLITEHVKRSQKLLEAIGKGRPICSPQWILDSKRAKQFLDPWDNILTDLEAETKWEFSLNESLQRSRAQNLLQDYNFYIQVTIGVDVLKGGIAACGGKCLSRIPSWPLENPYVISTVENRTKYKRILQKHPRFQVIEPEAVFDAVLRQEIRFSRHIIS